MKRLLLALALTWMFPLLVQAQEEASNCNYYKALYSQLQDRQSSIDTTRDSITHYKDMVEWLNAQNDTLTSSLKRLYYNNYGNEFSFDQLYSFFSEASLRMHSLFVPDTYIDTLARRLCRCHEIDMRLSKRYDAHSAHKDMEFLKRMSRIYSRSDTVNHLIQRLNEHKSATTEARHLLREIDRVIALYGNIDIADSAQVVLLKKRLTEITNGKLSQFLPYQYVLSVVLDAIRAKEENFNDKLTEYIDKL